MGQYDRVYEATRRYEPEGNRAIRETLSFRSRLWYDRSGKKVARIHTRKRDMKMSSVEKISVSLTPDLAAVLQEAVAGGEYASTSEVIREALRDWRAKRAERQSAIKEARRLWDEGIQSGPSRFQSVEEIIAEAREKKARG